VRTEPTFGQRSIGQKEPVTGQDTSEKSAQKESVPAASPLTTPDAFWKVDATRSAPASQQSIGKAMDVPLGQQVGSGNLFQKLFRSTDLKQRVTLNLSNDNFATLIDGAQRSDDGPTSTMGIHFEGNNSSLDYRLSFEHEMFTERGWGVGDRRTDRLSLNLDVGERTPLAHDGFFNQERRGYSLGLTATGNFGGATIQDQWHGLWEGTDLTGRRLDGSNWGVPLQSDYTKGGAALMLGAEYQLEKTWDGGRIAVGGQAKLALGTAGIHSAGLHAALELGEGAGLFGRYELWAGLQSVMGDSFAFDGAPVEGFIGQHNLEVGYRSERGVEVSLVFGSNVAGTQEGWGDRDGHQLGVNLGWSF
jgi:hypothetical protein